MASRAMEMRSPAVRSMSSSRPAGSSVICAAWSSSSSVVSPIAETTTTTSLPAYNEGNLVEPLIHGTAYFDRLVECVERLDAGDHLFFTDWRGDPDEQLRPGGPTVAQLFTDAVRRGVCVRGLVWRSHVDWMSFSAQENRALDDGEHRGDPQPLAMSAAYGDHPPWHDVQLMLRGPAVGVLDTVFRERWDDPTNADSGNPISWVIDRLRGARLEPTPLPPQLPPPPPCGPHLVQNLRTYPAIRPPYDFAPRGERSVARGYSKAIKRARRLIYLEDQYMWSADVARLFARALAEHPELHLVVVVPRVPDQDGAVAERSQYVGRWQALEMCQRAGRGRVHVFDVENHEGTPVYVHAKVCVVDDVWASVGSDNFNRRSWTHDSELSSAVL